MVEDDLFTGMSEDWIEWDAFSEEALLESLLMAVPAFAAYAAKYSSCTFVVSNFGTDAIFGKDIL